MPNSGKTNQMSQRRRTAGGAGGEAPPVGPGSGAPAAANPQGSISARILIGLIAIYRVVLSPILGGRCRFDPSCSVYTSEAIVRHGALKGTWLGLRRLLRCHPFHRGGYDPVPGRQAGGDGVAEAQRYNLGAPEAAIGVENNV